MTESDWQRIFRIMDEAFGNYETGLVALRKRIVGDVKPEADRHDGVDAGNRDEVAHVVPGDEQAAVATHLRALDLAGTELRGVDEDLARAALPRDRRRHR